MNLLLGPGLRGAGAWLPHSLAAVLLLASLMTAGAPLRAQDRSSESSAPPSQEARRRAAEQDVAQAEEQFTRDSLAVVRAIREESIRGERYQKAVRDSIAAAQAASLKRQEVGDLETVQVRDEAEIAGINKLRHPNSRQKRRHNELAEAIERQRAALVSRQQELDELQQKKKETEEEAKQAREQWQQAMCELRDAQSALKESEIRREAADARFAQIANARVKQRSTINPELLAGSGQGARPRTQPGRSGKAGTPPATPGTPSGAEGGTPGDKADRDDEETPELETNMSNGQVPTSRSFLPVVAGGSAVILLVGAGALWMLRRRAASPGRRRGPPPRLTAVPGGSVALGNAQHQGQRLEQQDQFYFSDPLNPHWVETYGIVGIVADGMGGMELGKEASPAAIRGFTAVLEQYLGRPNMVPEALSFALNAANDAVVRLTTDWGMTVGDVGTTLSAVAVGRHGLYWIAAGDTRIYLLRDGELHRVNVDHVLAQDLAQQVAAEKIDVAAAVHNPQKRAVTSSLGVPTLPQVDRSLYAYPLWTNDRVLVCTDGLYGTLSESQMREILLSTQLGASCEPLLHAALAQRKEGQDNITVIEIAYVQASSNGGGRWMLDRRGQRQKTDAITQAV